MVPILEGIQTINSYGMEVVSGIILGLDTDSRAAAGGRLEATVRTEPGTDVAWTLTAWMLSWPLALRTDVESMLRAVVRPAAGAARSRCIGSAAAGRGA